MAYGDEDLREEVQRLTALTVRLFQLQAITLARVELLSHMMLAQRISTMRLTEAEVAEAKASLRSHQEALEKEGLDLGVQVLGEVGLLPPTDKWWDRPSRE